MGDKTKADLERELQELRAQTAEFAEAKEREIAGLKALGGDGGDLRAEIEALREVVAASSASSPAGLAEAIKGIRDLLATSGGLGGVKVSPGRPHPKGHKFPTVKTAKGADVEMAYVVRAECMISRKGNPDGAGKAQRSITFKRGADLPEWVSQVYVDKLLAQDPPVLWHPADGPFEPIPGDDQPAPGVPKAQRGRVVPQKDENEVHGPEAASIKM
ncbi:MAG: hypothetical protein KKD44_29070 [Proteobacteria bacterium]|nr:hypothetical protein [Pseudomonadota bacterium]